MILVLIFSLFACSKGNESKENKKENAGKVDNADTDKKSEKKEPEVAEIEETVLVDEGGLKITALNIDYNYLSGTHIGVNIMIENNTGYDITLLSDEGGVNGYMLDASLAVDVRNGESVNDCISFYTSAIKRCDIETISFFEFKFRAESENYRINDGFRLRTDYVMLKTTAFDTYATNYTVDGTVIYDKNNIKVAVKDINYDYHWVLLFVENKSDAICTISEKDMYINGKEFWSLAHCELIPSERYTVMILEYSDDDMEEYGITDINEMKISVEIQEEHFLKVDTSELVDIKL